MQNTNRKIFLTVVNPTAKGWDIETKQAEKYITPSNIKLGEVRGFYIGRPDFRFSQRFFYYEGEDTAALIELAKSRAKALIKKNIETLNELLSAS